MRTTFATAFVTVVHDTHEPPVRVPGREAPIASLSDFLRLLHGQRRAHQAIRVPYAITQEIEDADAAADHAAA